MQSDLHGSGVLRQTSKEKPLMDDSSLSRKKIEAERELRDLWERGENRCPSQEPRLARQFIKELTETLQELPQQSPQTTSIRRLTPTECERLQGFPDGWTSKGIIDGKEVDISDSQRYKCLGNAVTTNVITEIGKRIYEQDLMSHL